MDWWDVLKAPIYYREEAQPFPRSQRERVVSQTAGEQPQEHFGQPPRNPNTTLSDSFDPNRDGYGFTELNLPGAFPPFRNRDPTGPTNTRDAFFEAQDESSRGALRLVSDNPPVYELPLYGVLDAARGQGMGREGIEEMRRDLEQRHGEPVQIIPQGMTMEALPFWDKMMEERVVDNPNRVEKASLLVVKYQTALPQFDPELDETTGYAGVPPVQMASAQNPKHTRDYLEGRYPPEFWAFTGKEASLQHGASPARADERGRFLDVGVRSQEPVGTDKKVGRMATPDEMPDKRNIVVRHRSAADHPRFKRDQEKRERQAAAERKRKQAIHQRRYGIRKEAKSPKALRHKREYETRYESSPERKRYRRDLERERRKRGVAGKGGKDMSHTKRGTIVPEDPHSNRARSHPSVGSTLKAIPEKFSDLVEVHHPVHHTPLEYDIEGQPKERLKDPLEFGDKCRHCDEGRELVTPEGAIGCSEQECHANTPEALQSSYGYSGNIHNPLPAARLNEVGGREGLVDQYTAGSVQADPTVRIHMTPRGPEALQPRQRPIVAHGRNVPNYDTSGYFTTGDPMDLSFRMLKEQTRLFQQGQQTLDGKPAFAPTDFAAMEQRRKEAEAEAKSKEARRQKMMEQARKAGMTTPLHEFAAQTPAPEDSQRPE